jgi:hypothetical protein
MRDNFDCILFFMKFKQTTQAYKETGHQVLSADPSQELKATHFLV